MREQLVVEAFDECEAARVERVETESAFVSRAPREREPGRLLCQRLVARVAQPALHVAEAVLVRHELDEPRAAIDVERADLVARQRAGVLPDLAMRRVG